MIQGINLVVCHYCRETVDRFASWTTHDRFYCSPDHAERDALRNGEGSTRTPAALPSPVLRDQAAIAVLAALLTRSDFADLSPDDLAGHAYAFADALLKAREAKA